MAITKENVIDQVTIYENGMVTYRTAFRIIEDGIKISETYHRSSLTPWQDTTNMPESVKAICTAAWSLLPEAQEVQNIMSEKSNNFT